MSNVSHLRALACAAAASVGLCAPAQAGSRVDSHAPIGVMGDHTHAAGEMMFSYRYMMMHMQGSQIGTDEVSPEQIATTVANRFADVPMQPPTLRVVPTQMDMTMHMLGMMYAPTDWVTVMGMLNVLDSEMDHVTFAGGSGTDRLGGFTTRSDGIGDLSLVGLFRLGADEHSRWHATAGVSLPTGSQNETGQALAPNGMQPTLRLPYPMQLGSGTYDLIGGLTWSAHQDLLGWGAQWRSVIRTGENDEQYTRGDEHKLTGWVSRTLSPTASISARLSVLSRGDIDGIDPQIVAPVQTADPDNHGLTRADLGLGVNLGGSGNWGGHRLALEVEVPVYQDLDCPQLQTDWQLMLGYQFARKTRH